MASEIILPAHKPKLVIDQGQKTPELYEYYPLQKVEGVLIPSLDIGKKHFGVYIHSMTTNRAVYAGIWKLGEKMDLPTQTRLTMLLNRLKPFFLASKTIFVEAQRLQNPVCLRLQQHVLTWAELTHPHLDVITVGSDVKYRKNDGPLGDQKHLRKKWCITKCLELFDEQGDGVATFIRKLEEMRLSQKDFEIKADDVCDAALQLFGRLKACTKKEREKWTL